VPGTDKGEKMMSVDLLGGFLGWCAILNMGVFLWWFLFYMLAHDWLYAFHGKWFKLSQEQFDGIHYAGMAGYKIAIGLFVIIPYLALRIVV
jgi:hypothetical protein